MQHSVSISNKREDQGLACSPTLPEYSHGPQLREIYIFQDPPKPMLILAPSTMTGTRRLPCVSSSISARACSSSLTSRYMTVNPSLALASRALRVKGQFFLPKIVISLVIMASLMGGPHEIDFYIEKIYQI